jgi:hypothetical protein
VPFRDKHPSVSIGFSRFPELCPKHCNLAGSRGTHTVSVLVIHQNITLKVQGAHLTANFNAKNLKKMEFSTESEMCISTV